MDYKSFCIEKPFNHIQDFDTHKILDEIKNNEIYLLELAHTSDYYFDSPKEFTDALAQNTSIQSVEFYGDFIGCLRGRERTEIVEAVGKLPNLRSVTLADSCLMVKSAISLLESAKSLKEFTMKRIVMQGLQVDFDNLESAIYMHPALNSYTMKECIAANRNVDMAPLEKLARSSAPTAPLPGGFPERATARAIAA